MKKTLLTILLSVFGFMFLAAPALAATSVSFTPVNVSVRQGQTFTLTIGVNPQGVKNYTAKTEIHFPADFLEVKSFTFANGWMPLSQSSYDLTDNTGGVLIKTAGYPGGVSSPIIFGTVSFLAKKSGSGVVALNSDSFVLDAGNQNVLTSAAVQAVVVALSPAPVQTAPATPAVEPTEETAVSEEAPIVTEPTTESQTVASPSLLAAVGGIITLGTGNVGIGILVVLVILVLVGYAFYLGTRRKGLGKIR